MAIEVVPTEVAVAQTCLLLGVRPEFIRAITRDVQALVTKDSPVRENLRAPRFTFKFDTVAAVSANGDCSTDPYISFAPQIYTYFGKPGCDFWDKDGALQVGRFANVRSKIDYANILKHYAAALTVAAANTKTERYRMPERKAHRDARVAEFQKIAAGVEAVAQAILEGKYDAEWGGVDV